jgi:8-oxo-dGTP pyrophosphatase MutT (NUDIX family)
MVEQREWNVIFLVDQNPPREVVLLQRAANKSFAPSFFIGVGGKIEPGESAIESAYRELREETGIDTVELKEFSRCVYDSDLKLYYFWGIYSNLDLPQTDDGVLHWVLAQEILSKDLIPTTRVICEEWGKRDFSVNSPFSIIVREIGKERGVRLVEVIDVREHLV